MTATLQTWYRSTLASKLEAADTTITVATAPTVTAWRMHVYSGSTHAWIKYTGLSGTTLTGVTFVSQTADPTTTVTWVTFSAWTSIELVEMHDQMLDKQQWGTVAGNMIFSWTVSATNSLKVPVYADATARDAAITVPSNGMVIYNTALGILQQYIGWAWTSFASGSVVNADTTTAGKVEIATTAEIDAGTDTGGTGAFLVPIPSQMIKKLSINSWSDGTDWALTISSWTTTLTATNGYVEKFYSSVTISGTALLNFSGKTANGIVAIINCSGDFTMSAGTIDMDAQWGNQETSWAGFIYWTTVGTAPTGQTGWTGIILPIGFTALKYCGSGGAVITTGTGWIGGWLLIIRVTGAVNFTGWTIKSSWSAGTLGGGGGGGGTVVIMYGTLTANSGTITVDGWAGWSGGTTNETGGGGGLSFASGGAGGALTAVGTAGSSNSYWTGGAAGAGSANGGGGGGWWAGYKYVGKFLL